MSKNKRYNQMNNSFNSAKPEPQDVIEQISTEPKEVAASEQPEAPAKEESFQAAVEPAPAAPSKIDSPAAADASSGYAPVSSSIPAAVAASAAAVPAPGHDSISAPAVEPVPAAPAVVVAKKSVPTIF